MSETTKPPTRRNIVIRILLILLYTILILLLLLFLLVAFSDFGVVVEFVIHLAGGWFLYLKNVTSQITMNGGLIGSSLVALGLAVLGLHALANWLWRRSRPAANPWSFRWTAAITTMLLLLFASANAGAGIGHQIGWLKSMDWVESNWELMRPRNQARQILIAIDDWAYDHDDNYPLTLAEAVHGKIDEPASLLLVNLKADSTPEPWLYFGPALGVSPAVTRLLIAAPRSHKGLRVVGYTDGTSSAIREEEYQKLLGQRHQVSN